MSVLFENNTGYTFGDVDAIMKTGAYYAIGAVKTAAKSVLDNLLINAGFNKKAKTIRSPGYYIDNEIETSNGSPTCAGVILVSKEYAAILYSHQMAVSEFPGSHASVDNNFFGIIFENGVEFTSSHQEWFRKMSPLNHLSTPFARKYGIKPTSLAMFDDGCVASYPTDIFTRSIGFDCKYVAFKKGELLGAFEVGGGVAPTLFWPTNTEKQLAGATVYKAIQQGWYYGSFKAFPGFIFNDNGIAGVKKTARALGDLAVSSRITGQYRARGLVKDDHGNVVVQTSKQARVIAASLMEQPPLEMKFPIDAFLVSDVSLATAVKDALANQEKLQKAFKGESFYRLLGASYYVVMSDFQRIIRMFQTYYNEEKFKSLFFIASTIQGATVQALGRMTKLEEYVVSKFLEVAKNHQDIFSGSIDVSTFVRNLEIKLPPAYYHEFQIPSSFDLGNSSAFNDALGQVSGFMASRYGSVAPVELLKLANETSTTEGLAQVVKELISDGKISSLIVTDRLEDQIKAQLDIQVQKSVKLFDKFLGEFHLSAIDDKLDAAREILHRRAAFGKKGGPRPKYYEVHADNLTIRDVAISANAGKIQFIATIDSQLVDIAYQWRTYEGTTIDPADVYTRKILKQCAEALGEKCTTKVSLLGYYAGKKYSVHHAGGCCAWKRYGGVRSKLFVTTPDSVSIQLDDLEPAKDLQLQKLTGYSASDLKNAIVRLSKGVSVGCSKAALQIAFEKVKPYLANISDLPEQIALGYCEGCIMEIPVMAQFCQIDRELLKGLRDLTKEIIKVEQEAGVLVPGKKKTSEVLSTFIDSLETALKNTESIKPALYLTESQLVTSTVMSDNNNVLPFLLTICGR